MKYQIPYFFRKLEKMLQNLSSAAVVIGALRVNKRIHHLSCPLCPNISCNSSKMGEIVSEEKRLYLGRTD